MGSRKTYVFDLDNTLCTEEKTFERACAQPIPQMIDRVNQLFDRGHRIIIYTARSWMEYRMTEKWLQNYGVKFHLLLCGKPLGDVWVDDRAVNARDFKLEGE